MNAVDSTFIETSTSSSTSNNMLSSDGPGDGVVDEVAEGLINVETTLDGETDVLVLLRTVDSTGV